MEFPFQPFLPDRVLDQVSIEQRAGFASNKKVDVLVLELFERVAPQVLSRAVDELDSPLGVRGDKRFVDDGRQVSEISFPATDLMFQADILVIDPALLEEVSG